MRAGPRPSGAGGQPAAGALVGVRPDAHHRAPRAVRPRGRGLAPCGWAARPNHPRTRGHAAIAGAAGREQVVDAVAALPALPAPADLALAIAVEGAKRIPEPGPPHARR